MVRCALVALLLAAGAEGFASSPVQLDCGAQNSADACEADESRQRVTVFGHTSPDTDAIACAIIYAWELRTPVGDDPMVCAREYVNTDPANRETQFLLNYFGVPMPPTISSVSESTGLFSVVDSNNPDMFPSGAPGLIGNQLFSVMDHHKSSGLITHKPILLDIRPVGSTGSVLYSRSIAAGRTIPGKGCPVNIAGLMLATILSDTLGFRSPTATPQDRAAAAALAPLAGIDDTEAFTEAMLDAKADVSGYTAAELVMIDSKAYDFFDGDGVEFTLRIAVMETVKPQRLFDMASELSAACYEQLLSEREERGPDKPTLRAVLFFVIDVLEVKATYLPTSDDDPNAAYADELVTRALFPSRDGADIVTPLADQPGGPAGSLLLPGVLSRKKQIIPGLVGSAKVVEGFSL